MKKVWRLRKIKLVEENVSDERFLEYARELSQFSPSLILLSGSDHDSALYSIACWNPYHAIIYKNPYFTVYRNPYHVIASQRRSNLIKEENIYIRQDGNPLDYLDLLMESFSVTYPQEIPPFTGGAVGYIAYEAKNVIEKLPQKARDDLFLPDLFFFFPQEMLIHHRKTGELFYVAVSPSSEEFIEKVDLFAKDSPGTVEHRVYGWQSNFSREDYIRAVQRILAYIRDGHVYQVNLSQRYSFNYEGDLFELFVKLYKKNPAPFYAFLNAESYSIVCTSMERFLFLRNGVIETRPIKGTRPRGKTPEEDAALISDLLSHPKDDAELSMIVDLLRNDLGKICRPGSVYVAEHKRIESYQNVHHLISIVRGEINDDVSYGKIFKATFPGGSITGCPKIRSMEIIDELEPNVRHVYTGSIGYLGFHGNMDTNIAIRTMIAVNRGSYCKCFLSVGGGVVYDSDPELEYEETLHKGRTFFELLQRI